jgi:hypothetical protein
MSMYIHYVICMHHVMRVSKKENQRTKNKEQRAKNKE